MSFWAVLEVREPRDRPPEDLALEGIDLYRDRVAAVDERHVKIRNQDDNAHQVGPGDREHCGRSTSICRADEIAVVEVAMGDDTIIGRGDLGEIHENLGFGQVGLGRGDIGLGRDDIGPGLTDPGNRGGEIRLGGDHRRDRRPLGAEGRVEFLLLLVQQSPFDGIVPTSPAIRSRCSPR